jgi:hypothetical protein
MKFLSRLTLVLLLCPLTSLAGIIDRHAVITRNNPKVSVVDPLQSLTVGNGGFAVTVDATGLQTFPEEYSVGVPLGTMSDWGWHSFRNPRRYKPEDALVEKDFGRGHKELYSAQFKAPGRQHDASEWLRINPHRLHLGVVGFNFSRASHVNGVSEELDMWTGTVKSDFRYGKKHYSVMTVCSPDCDRIASRIVADETPEIRLRYPYPTGGHSDDACDWKSDGKHKTSIVKLGKNSVILRHQLDATTYYIYVTWTGEARLKRKGNNEYLLSFKNKETEISVEYALKNDFKKGQSFAEIAAASAAYWNKYWRDGAIVDFGYVKDPRAKELERRVVLSQYIMATNDGGDTPPQETGLTYNSWYGKFHLEMIWWHQAQFALWGHPEMLDRSLNWYHKVEPIARQIAERQGFKGIRWMKMTDPSGQEAPSNVGSYLIWQQPHLIYLAELLYRANPSQELLDRYGDLVEKTAEFMADFATYDAEKDRYILKGCIAAQETLEAATNVNPPYELSYWHWALRTANQWRKRRHEGRNEQWDTIVEKLSPLAFNSDSLYQASESATDTYTNLKMTSDHPALLGAMGVLPDNKLINDRVMNKTLDWIFDNWNWPTSWGWDFPMTAMTAARLGRPEDAVKALLMPMQKNTYLVNGHNWQSDRLRCYLPGNGGLLTAVAMMCAGWDGTKANNPGFPSDWNVRWEGLMPMP